MPKSMAGEKFLSSSETLRNPSSNLGAGSYNILEEIKMAKKLKVEIEWKLLERIAEYYKFPSAVFLGNLDVFKHAPKTRDKVFRKKVELFDKIKELTEEFK